MLLHELVDTSLRVAATRKRSTKIELLASCLVRLAPEEIEAGASFLMGVLPEGRIGIAGALLRDVASVEPASVPMLSVLDVQVRFETLAAIEGRGSTTERRHVLGDLFAHATREEQSFLARLVVGELRQGALEGIFVEAVARAANVAVDDVRRAVMVVGEAASVARSALTEGANGLSRYSLTVLRPIRPMLAQPADDPADAIARLGRTAFELKLDGARVQIHKAGDDVRVFSRKLNDVTGAVPEVVELARALPARELVLDGETIALTADGTPLPFQATMRRFGRKLDVERMRSELPLATYLFDCLYRDGRDLTGNPEEERFGALADVAPTGTLTPRVVTDVADEAEAFLADALRRGHEGVMAKGPGSHYEAGSRGGAWLKIKLAHTLDLVILAAEWGHGRRSGLLSNLHLGARDPHAGGFVMLGKTFKGMTDEMLTWQTEKLLSLAIARDDWTVHVRPEVVVEIAFNDIQASPQYPGGLALRFARVKSYRPDKPVTDADTIATVRQLYARQTRGGVLHD